MKRSIGIQESPAFVRLRHGGLRLQVPTADSKMRASTGSCQGVFKVTAPPDSGNSRGLNQAMLLSLVGLTTAPGGQGRYLRSSWLLLVVGAFPLCFQPIHTH